MFLNLMCQETPCPKKVYFLCRLKWLEAMLYLDHQLYMSYLIWLPTIWNITTGSTRVLFVISPGANSNYIIWCLVIIFFIAATFITLFLSMNYSMVILYVSNSSNHLAVCPVGFLRFLIHDTAALSAPCSTPCPFTIGIKCSWSLNNFSQLLPCDTVRFLMFVH